MEQRHASSKGDLIWIAESDDVADLQFLEKLVPHFEKILSLFLPTANLIE